MISIRHSLASRPVVITASVSAAYIAFYTAYDKSSKKLTLKNIQDLVTGGRGWGWTFTELNKALSLTGLTTLLVAFLHLPDSASLDLTAIERKELLWISMNILWGHSIYSFYKFYGFKLSKVVSDTKMKKLSVTLGTAGQLLLSAGYWGYISANALAYGSIVLGVTHFWTMEVDSQYVLQVRPFAYLPFPLAAAALYTYYVKYVKD